jgi:hypothetical protein
VIERVASRHDLDTYLNREGVKFNDVWSAG